MTEAKTHTLDDGVAARTADAAWLAAALQSSRADTLATFAAVEASLPDLQVSRRPTLNPPLWELGHIGWFQEYWIGRSPQRFAGIAADPGLVRGVGQRAQADALYDSSQVAHERRWSLPLPSADETRQDLAAQLTGTLAWLREADGRDNNSDTALYFFRLALLHEDMHHEAALYMAQSLGLPIDDRRWQTPRLPLDGGTLDFDAGPWRLGSGGATGFVFDNELAGQRVELPALQIDRRVLSWAEFLPFVDAGGYHEPHWWSENGAAWRAATQARAPRYLRCEEGAWQQWRHGTWCALDLQWPACHLSQHEAEAWCRWAGRRLPSEAEWERSALERPGDFAWGQVWEWTASRFRPYPGFEPHPYRDYSAPWFDSREVLRGASFMTQARMRHPRYRNFFAAERNDVPAGFRTCRQRTP